MGFKDILNSLKSKNERFKELQEEDRAMQKVEERKLSANERALNKILKEKREEQIAKELNKYNKQQQNEWWHKDTVTQPYIFREKSTMLKQKKLFTRGKR